MLRKVSARMRLKGCGHALRCAHAAEAGRTCTVLRACC